jgi:glycosyltransferase involved in cell wall biosynthesis
VQKPRSGYFASVTGRSRLRIALIAPCWYPVPPTAYGGIERIVALLADGLVEAGHDVTLFAAPGSRTRARLLAPLPEAPSHRIGEATPAIEHALACYRRAARFDLINDHSGLVAAALALAAGRTPVCHTAHGPLTGEDGRAYRAVCEVNPALRLISLSTSQQRTQPDLPWLATCRNAVDLDHYSPAGRRGEHLLFLGRIAPEKGPVAAIKAARAAGLPIILAGKMQEAGERAYFERAVKPLLGDGATYAGEVSGEEQLELLRTARATLFPISWPEPFGLVMIESMACGTPVVATRYGAVAEVIEDGVGGVIVEDEADVAGAIGRALALDPVKVRASVERRFAPQRMVADYIDAYRRLTMRTPRQSSLSGVAAR